ncbi:MAG: glycosyltransferase [Gemmataceae bacterium]
MITLDLHGHLNPMTTLGAELRSRRHQVTLLGSSLGRKLAEQAGLNWSPLNDTSEAMSGWNQLGRLSGLSALKHTGRLVNQNAKAIFDELPGHISTLKIDALVIDQFTPAAAIVAENQKIPYVVACNALAVHLHPSVPPTSLNWPYRRGVFGNMRNRFGNWITKLLFDTFAGAGRKGGISPLLLVDLKKKWGEAIVSQQPECFEFPNHPRPSHFHYTAPWHVKGRDKSIFFPWEKLDGRPLVFASLGTLQNQLLDLFIKIVDAARGLNLQLVLSLGSQVAKWEFDVPDNVIVVPFAPQLQLLDRSAAVITHAGLNTALEAVSRGLPMICLPITNDQPGIARRIEYHGAGIVLHPNRATANQIRSKLQVILSDPVFQKKSIALRDQVVKLQGLRIAADIIENAVCKK